MAATFGVGRIDDKAKKLIHTTRECLLAGIKKAIAGNYIGDISYAIQSLAEKIIFCGQGIYLGHGVGLMVHEDPQIPNYGKPGTGLRLKEGW